MKRLVVPNEKKLQLVIIGNGMTAHKFCEKFVRYGLSRRYDLVIYGKEMHPAYDRVNLTKFFTDGVNLSLAPISWYHENKLSLKTGEKVTHINPQEKWISTENDTIQSYDKLIIATGSLPYVPNIPGVNLPGVFVYRTIEDLKAIKNYLAHCRRALVIGGGILGLEAARALIGANLQTTVVERERRLMPKQLDDIASQILQSQIEKLGVTVMLNNTITSLVKNGRSINVTCANGDQISCDMVVISAGIIPCDDLAFTAGLQLGANGGIVVTNSMVTSDPDIYAIGECAVVYNRTWGLAAPCFEMADVLAARLANIFKVFRGGALFTKLKVLETKVAYIGDSLDTAENCDHLSEIDIEKGIYKRISISTDGKAIVGAILIGDISAYSVLLNMIRNRTRIHVNPLSLLRDTRVDQSKRVEALPDDAIICLCEAVPKKVIVDFILHNKSCCINSVKKHTHAGTGCESCLETLDEMLVAYTSLETT